jgi:hypothetical protein
MTLCLNFIFFFIIMEKNQKITYSLKEKFLLVWPEQRLSWRKAGLRIFSSAIAILLLTYLVAFLWALFFQFITVSDDIQIIILSILSIVITYLLYWFIDPILITKRIHDFNDSGIIYVRIYKIILLVLATIGIIESFQKDVFWITLSNISMIVKLDCLYFLFIY